MRTGAASAVGARRHNENDVTIMTIAGYWRHVATGSTALVRLKRVYTINLPDAVTLDGAYDGGGASPVGPQVT